MPHEPYWTVESEPTTSIEGDAWGVFTAHGDLVCVCPTYETAQLIAAMDVYRHSVHVSIERDGKLTKVV